MNTRDCSESRCKSSSDGRGIAGSSLSESSDSFVEHDGEKKSNVPSSDSSFVNVDPVHKDFKVDVNESNETDVTSVEQTVIRPVDPSIHSIPRVDNNYDKFQCGHL